MIHDLVSLGCMMTGTAGTVCFLLPVLTGRIINIGNMTGFFVSAGLILYGRRQKRVHALLRGLWDAGGLPRTALLLGGCFFCAVLITAAVLTIMILGACFKKPAGHATVIVLGCQVRGDRPSRMLTGRMEAAVKYLRHHPQALCIVSGGQGEDEAVSEAECMFRYMTGRGIAPERILLEDRSVSTRENILFSAGVLRENGMGDEIAIVTNEFHACRALLCAEKAGLRAGSVTAPTPWWLLPTFYVRELYGLLYQILKG